MSEQVVAGRVTVGWRRHAFNLGMAAMVTVITGTVVVGDPAYQVTAELAAVAVAVGVVFGVVSQLHFGNMTGPMETAIDWKGVLIIIGAIGAGIVFTFLLPAWYLTAFLYAGTAALWTGSIIAIAQEYS